MSEGFLSFLRVVKAIVLYVGLGALVAFIFYNLRKRDLFGGYIGGLVVGVIGALIGGLVLDSLFYDKIVGLRIALSSSITERITKKTNAHQNFT